MSLITDETTRPTGAPDCTIGATGTVGVGAGALGTPFGGVGVAVGASRNPCC